jgi:hypothetical protein
MAENIKIYHKDIEYHAWEEASGGLLQNGNESQVSTKGGVFTEKRGI